MGCPICGRRFRAFAPFNSRPRALCRGCGSLERHRALWLLLESRPDLLAPGSAVLDLAPNAALERKLRAIEGIRYTTADLERDDVDVRLDVTAMALTDASWDLVICSHVLEHVLDDGAAIGELHRVLRPGGTALVMVPHLPVLARSIEDRAAVTPEQRLRTFGQPDHVRIYARADLTERLAAGGFDVDVVETIGLADDAALFRGELIWEARRPCSAAA